MVNSENKYVFFSLIIFAFVFNSSFANDEKPNLKIESIEYNFIQSEKKLIEKRYGINPAYRYAYSYFMLTDIDTDGDGVFNATDLDDDNDGILDEIENSCNLPSGYDAYWSFDDTTDDISGAPEHDLQNSPTITYSSDSPNGTKSIQFDGSTTLLQYSDGIFLNTDISTFTYAFWIKPTSLVGEQVLIDQGGGGNGFSIRLVSNTLECGFRTANTTYTTNTFTVNADTWQHIAAVFDNGNLTFYLDGVPSTTITTPATLPDHGNVSGFGASNGQNAFRSGAGNFFTGFMDEILHYPIAIGPAQINQIKNSVACTPEDTDNDGIDDYLDLDSDNDGIPDNIEAQATNSYILPNSDTPATYLSNKGVNSAYLGGLTPPNTDSDSNPDYQDTNSDNEGDDDTTEAGFVLLNDFGSNGLDSSREANDSYSDVNGNVNDPTVLPDTDSDILSGGDVDYRDKSISTPFSFDATASANDLAAYIEGPGITITNPTVTIGNANQTATFDGAIQGKKLEIDRGILFTTGTATETFSNNNDNGSTTNQNTTTNDTDLASIANGTTNDPVIFEIDVILDNTATVLSIDYQFASDEYNEYVCSGFNDVFGYFVSGPGIAGTQNIALVPGTNNSVSISNINNGTPGNQGNAANCGDLTQSNYFIDNPIGSNNVLIEYDGITKVIRATAKNLTPGATYTVKFAIADVGDGGWDSAIFINLISGLADNDSDGIYDDLDVDDDNDGIFDNTEDANLDNDSNPLTNPTDTDGDGIFNYIDLDSDNDGIPDNVEAQTTADYIFPNSTYNGSGADTAYPSGLSPVNTDGTDNPDYLDSDSDNEGGNDTTESGLTLVGNVGNNGLDNNVENNDNYSDVNGNINNPNTLPDSDGDLSNGGDVDFRDAIASGDNDGDGVDDATDLDDDNDGILDTEEGIVLDTDSDGLKNYRDLDSDGDGIPDNIEAQETNNYTPPNIDTPEQYLANNGINSAYIGVNTLIPTNTDLEDTPDYLDLDSDNEGGNDNAESGITLSGATGVNGLDSNVYTSNDYLDVNGIIDNPNTLPDSDTDLATGGDVDFRDDFINVTAGSGNLLWLRADLNAAPSLWQDQSGNNHDATASVTPTINSSGINFNPSFVLNGSTQFMQITNGILGTDSYNNLWAYVVSKTNTIQNSNLFFESMANSERLRARIPFGDAELEFRFGDNNTANGVIKAPWGGQTNTFNVWNFSQSNTDINPSGANKALYRDGLRFSSSSGFDTSRTGNDSNFLIGSNGTNYHDGEIAEILIFSGIPSAQEQQSVQSYLAIKYGITLDFTNNNGNITEGDYLLSNGATKVWNYGENSGYHNDVAGIGKDATRSFAQKQSKSINSDGLITMGLGTIENDNISNLNSFENDKDFLMWGNNDATGTTLTSSVLCSTSLVMNRIWKVVETGSVGTVQIAAEETTVRTNLGGSNEQITLKVADDAALTINVEFISLNTSTINGTQQLQGNFDFNGTKYFSFTEVTGITWDGAANNNNGEWNGGSNSNGAPNNSNDTNKLVTIDSNGGSNPILNQDISIGCLWIKQGSTLTIDNSKLEIADELQLDGDLKMIGDAQLIQTHTGGNSKVTGSGSIYIDQKPTAETKYRFNYLTSPVTAIGQNSYSVSQILKDGTTPTSATSNPDAINWVSGYDGNTNTSPISLSGYWIYSYLNGLTATSWIQQGQNGTLEPGEGFTLKGPGGQQNYTFVGTPNDGDISTTINGNHNSLLGNPYPSALDSDALFAENQSISTLYFWEHTGDSGNHNQGSYQGGYSTRNATTGIAAAQPAAGTGGLGNGAYNAPRKYIPVGQGFFLQAGAASTITFRNSQRFYKPLGSESIFLKGKKKKETTVNSLPVLKIGFEYTNDDNLDLHKQIAISFKEGNTFKREISYDSQAFSTSETDVFFKFENVREKFIIAGIQEISDDLEVPITVQMNYDGTSFLMVDSKLNIPQPLYLVDKLNDTETILNTNPIPLNLDKGTYNNRFYVTFKSKKTLSTDTTDAMSSLSIFYDSNEKSLKLKKASSIVVTEIKLFNSIGIHIKDWKNKEHISVDDVSKGLYIVKLKTSEGEISKKVLIY